MSLDKLLADIADALAHVLPRHRESHALAITVELLPHPAQQNMSVSVFRIVVLDCYPFELRAEVYLHLPHYISHVLPEIYALHIVGTEDHSPVPRISRERPVVCRIHRVYAVMSRVKSNLFVAGFLLMSAFHVTGMRFQFPVPFVLAEVGFVRDFDHRTPVINSLGPRGLSRHVRRLRSHPSHLLEPCRPPPELEINLTASR